MSKKLQDQYIKVNDAKVRYWDVGQGENTIVLVHGLYCSCEYWEHNIFELAKQYRVVALDLLGFGKTDKPAVTYNPDLLVKFLKDFFDILGLKKLFLVGHSLGSGVCSEFAYVYPERVKKLILVSATIFDKALPLSLRLLSLPSFEKLITRMTSRIMANAIRLYTYDRKILSDEFIDTIYRLNRTAGARYVLINILHGHVNLSGIRGDVIEFFHQHVKALKIPVLIIWGKQDKIAPIKGAYICKQLLPAAELHIFDKCGHIPQIEYAEEFNRLVLLFVRK